MIPGAKAWGERGFPGRRSISLVSKHGGPNAMSDIRQLPSSQDSRETARHFQMTAPGGAKTLFQLAFAGGDSPGL